MMQWVDEPQSKYGRKLICTGADIDEAMEGIYLKYYNGTCDTEQPAFNIERFIDESLIKEGIEYDPEATDLPCGVLGATQFNPDGSRLIRINTDLYRQRNSSAERGRFRFTCAHESFHAMFHSRLFLKGGNLVCSNQHIREDIIEPSHTENDFTEWQANRGAAALLMPYTIFTESVRRIRLVSRSISNDALMQALSDLFEVSKRAVRIRMATLGLTLTRDDLVLEHDGIDSFGDIRQR